MTIVEFITARVDEDEAVARECDALYFRADERSSGLMDIEAHYHPVEEDRHFRWFTHQHPGFPPAYAQHIARHDPARVLQQVKALRAVIDYLDPDGQFDEEVFADIAAIWNTHPDYQQEWANG